MVLRGIQIQQALEDHDSSLLFSVEHMKFPLSYLLHEGQKLQRRVCLGYGPYTVPYILRLHRGEHLNRANFAFVLKVPFSHFCKHEGHKNFFL